MMNQLHQNLNQIAQICNTLSQNEQSNVSRLSQMVDAERSAAQQLQHCAQLCQQVSQQMQSMMSSSQFSGSQYSGFATTGAGVGTSNFTTGGNYSTTGNYPSSSWANRPINTSTAFASSPSYSGSYGSSNFENANELTPTGASAFNTNKDLGN